MNFSKVLHLTDPCQNSVASIIKKCIPEKMKCGLAFQYLPESIHMVKRYEIITERCKPDIAKLIKSAKWRYKRK